jgi:hypothetical protein
MCKEYRMSLQVRTDKKRGEAVSIRPTEGMTTPVTES